MAATLCGHGPSGDARCSQDRDEQGKVFRRLYEEVRYKQSHDAALVPRSSKPQQARTNVNFPGACCFVRVMISLRHRSQIWCERQAQRPQAQLLDYVWGQYSLEPQAGQVFGKLT